MAGAALRASLALALVLLFCGWAILLGGLSGLTHACNDINNTNTTYMQYLLVNGQSNINPNLSCGYTYGYYWWILAFILIVLLVAIVEVVAPNTFRLGAGLLMAIVATLAMEYSDRFLTLSRKLNAGNFGSGAVPSSRTVASGFIISCIAALWALVTLGLAEEEQEKVGVSSPLPAGGKKGTAAAGASTGTSPGGAAAI